MSLQFALDHPDMVKALVLVDTSSGDWEMAPGYEEFRAMLDDLARNKGLEAAFEYDAANNPVKIEKFKQHPELKEEGYKMNDFGAIVATAALAHDIGNPPFGHSGEKSIGEYFKLGKGLKYKDQLTAAEWQDLIDFEGNANGFKILTETKNGVEGGLRLSYATLGAFMKYPKDSLPKKPTKHIADKKYGVFQSEKEFFVEVAEELGLQKRGEASDLSYGRHPLAYLVEAADDICYTIIDFEDGINLGLIDEEFALEYLINLVKENIYTEKYNNLTKASDR